MSIYKKQVLLNTVHFRCKFCRKNYESEADRIDEQTQPVSFYAECPHCGRENQQVAWERNLLIAHTKATGPKTEKGLIATSKNLIGHPTLKETEITKFNALKHGLYARTATFYPAKPGKYSRCESCDIEHDYCKTQVACLKQTELFMRNHIAFESKDPSLLLELRADLQSNIQAIIDSMIHSIIKEGVAISKPDWFVADGHLQFVKLDGNNVNQIEAHPLLRVLIDLLSKNNLTLADMQMTPKIQDEHEIIKGHLSKEANEQENLVAFQDQQNEALDKLKGYIEESERLKNEDSILIEYKQEK